MYEIDRQENQVVTRKGGHAVYTASLDSYIIYRSGGTESVSQVKDLSTEKLLHALATTIEIKC